MLYIYVHDMPILLIAVMIMCILSDHLCMLCVLFYVCIFKLSIFWRSINIIIIMVIVWQLCILFTLVGILSSKKVLVNMPGWIPR